jgi:hypothetical protein
MDFQWGGTCLGELKLVKKESRCAEALSLGIIVDLHLLLDYSK